MVRVTFPVIAPEITSVPVTEPYFGTEVPTVIPLMVRSIDSITAGELKSLEIVHVMVLRPFDMHTDVPVTRLECAETI
jgi:hypothetical protein